MLYWAVILISVGFVTYSLGEAKGWGWAVWTGLLSCCLSFWTAFCWFIYMAFMV